jgi:hypothetical protein
VYSIGMYANADEVAASMSKHQGKSPKELAADPQVIGGKHTGCNNDALTSSACVLKCSVGESSQPRSAWQACSRASAGTRSLGLIVPAAIDNTHSSADLRSVEKELRFVITMGRLTSEVFWNVLNERLTPMLPKVRCHR